MTNIVIFGHCEERDGFIRQWLRGDRNNHQMEERLKEIQVANLTKKEN